jgi:hypothetical protein
MSYFLAMKQVVTVVLTGLLFVWFSNRTTWENSRVDDQGARQSGQGADKHSAWQGRLCPALKTSIIIFT